MPDNTNGSIVALIPAASDPITAASSEPAHITLAWLGDAADLSPEDIDALRAEVTAYFDKVDDVITASVVGRETLGDEGADVVTLEGEGLRALRDGLVAQPKVAEVMARVEQYPDWKPHVTMGYPDSPANGEYDGETVTFDTASLWVGTEREDMPLVDQEETVDEEPEVPEEETEEVEPTDEEMSAGLADMDDGPVPWHGVLAPTGVESGDSRIFDEGSLTWRELPLPFRWQKFDDDGHDASVVVGNITNIWYEDNLYKAEGFFASTREAAEIIALRAEDMMRGVSVDADMAVSEFATRSGQTIDPHAEMPPDDDPVVQHVISARIASAAIVSIPAYQEAWFDLGTWADEEVMQNDAEQDDEEPAETVEAAAETFAPGTKDGPGWITHPKPTARIRRYWTKGKGAAKIRWGQPGDFNRCRTQLVKYVQNPEWLAGTCANMHKEALGIWPGQHSTGGTVTASAQMAPSLNMVEPLEALTAAGAPLSASWFANPELSGPTPMTITEDGQVYGHAATWNECHIGIQDRCVTAPHSITDYAYFHTGEVMTDEGPLAVGNITMSTGHAGLDLGAGPAAAHYDNTGTVIADVRMGEDKYGIWFSGKVRSSATEEQVASLRAAAISGDWRPIGAGLEMVAALAVNTPGFPVPRLGLAASGSKTTALVAAAVVTRDEKDTSTPVDMQAFARQVIAEVRADDERRAKMSSIAASLGKENRDRRNALLARMDGGDQ